VQSDQPGPAPSDSAARTAPWGWRQAGRSVIAKNGRPPGVHQDHGEHREIRIGSQGMSWFTSAALLRVQAPRCRAARHPPPDQRAQAVGTMNGSSTGAESGRLKPPIRYSKRALPSHRPSWSQRQRRETIEFCSRRKIAAVPLRSWRLPLRSRLVSTAPVSADGRLLPRHSPRKLSRRDLSPDSAELDRLHGAGAGTKTSLDGVGLCCTDRTVQR